MKKQRWLLVLGITFLGLLFVSTSSWAEVTLRVANQASQWADTFKKFAPKFTEETGIKIEFEHISFGVMYEKWLYPNLSISNKPVGWLYYWV